MNCSYCGKEIKDRWSFCMYCGSKLEGVAEPVQEIPAVAVPVMEPPVAEVSAVEPPAVEAPAFVPPVVERPVFEVPDFRGPMMDTPEVAPDAFQGRKITIDPEKFEFHPEVRDEPLPKGVSSWELVPAKPTAPKLVLPAKRSLCKMIFLGLVTLGIYPMVIYSKIITELNIAASRYDGKRTMTFYGMMMLAPLTLGVYTFVWYHNLCARIGDELQRRSIDYKFGPSHFWLWNILGSFILVGPFIFLHKLMKSMNLINKDFNEKG